MDEIDAMLGRKSRNQPQESELTQENNRMRKLISQGRAVYTRKGWVEIEPKKTSWDKGNVKYLKVPVVGRETEANSKFLRKQLNAEDRDMEERMTRVEAEALADKMITALEPYVDFSEVCGSFRRGRKDPGDLDVVIIMKPGESLPEIIDKLSGLYTAINWLGEKKTQIIVDGVKVDIKVSNPEGIGAALLYFTGPSGYNIGMRRSAKSRGLKLNEYGIWNRDTNEYLGGATEEEIYDILGKTYKPPEKRAEEEEEEPLDDDEYWEPYMEAVEEYWRMCYAYVNESGESYQGMVQHINLWQDVAEATSHSLNYVLEKAWKFKYDALRMIYNGDAEIAHEWVLEQMSQKDYELLEDFNPENRNYDGEYVFTNYSPGVPTLTWLKDNLNPWYLSREEGKPYAFDLYR